MGLRDGLIKATETDLKSKDLSVAPLTDMNEFPMVNYDFAIYIGGERVALFQKVSGMKVERNIDELTQGGFNEYTYEFSREFSYSHITFHTGLTSSDFFYKWMMFGKEGGMANSLNFVLMQRIYDGAGRKIKSWAFDGAFPVKWKISDLSMDNSKNIIVEELELSFNFFELEDIIEVSDASKIGTAEAEAAGA